ncbi:MAG: methyltransferase domain-containing protein [Thermoplasmata archaeon]
MKDVERASQTFDEIAEHFDMTRNRPWKEVVEFLESCDGSLLDMGCGNGRHTLTAEEMGLDVLGLDASRNLLRIASSRTDSDFVRGDVKELPFKGTSFDNVIYVAAIHHLSEGSEESLSEVRRVLKWGGRVLVSSWARELDRWDLEEDEREVLVPWHRDDGEIVERYYRLYTLDELREEVEKSGLEVVEYYRSGENNYVEGRKNQS